MTHQTVLKVVVAAFAAAVPLASQAAISITSTAFSYTQDFDTLASTNSASLPWTNDSTLPGWSLFRQPLPGTALTTYGADNGSSTAGSFYSYGTNGSTERALGGLGANSAYFSSPANGAVAGAFAVSFTNNTGQTLTSATISFDGEQWRNGGNTSAQTMLLQYGIGATFTSVSTWVTPGGNFNWTSPVVGSTAAALDGNLAANRVAGRGGSITGTLANGATLWIRWVENNDAGNDHGLAIDNFSFSVTPVPEPSSGVLLAAGAALLGALRIRRRATRTA